MHLRNIFILGLGAAFAAVTPAIAGPIHGRTVDADLTASVEQPTKPEIKKHTQKSRKRVAKAEPVVEDDAPIENNGELRSEQEIQPNLFSALFGGNKQQLLPETRALDTALAQKEERHRFKVKPEFQPQSVPYTGYPRGTIIIDTGAKFLYLMESSSTARRYPIAVGREGLQFKGAGMIGDKQEWPRWIPTLDMQKREPKHYGQYKDGMPGGLTNPLGARAMYVYQGGRDTHIRIHGTIQPQTIGTSASNGCFRMYNDQVMDLYRRVRVGTPVVVL
jgi:lipoprotein-anchoring transpeptidase ErfK/SrfK